jgi:D-hexose-6-phosphate mutarotase
LFIFLILSQNAGFTKAVVKLKSNSTAEIYFHGAQLTSFKNETGKELIFLRSLSLYYNRKINYLIAYLIVIYQFQSDISRR